MTELDKNWKIADIAIAIILELLLTLGSAITFNTIVQNNKIVNLFCTFAIHFIVILYLNRKYPIYIFKKVNYKLVFFYIIIGVLLSSLKHINYYYWLANNKYALPQYAIIKTYTTICKEFYLFVYCLLLPLTEELIFRGYFYRIIKNRYDNIYLGAIISTSLFVAFHAISPHHTNLIDIAVQGLIYVYVYEKSKSLWSSIGTHSLNNSLWFFLTYFVLK